MTGVTIITPIDIKPAMLVSTDVPEADYPVYVAGTTYAVGDRVIYGHMIYQSKTAGNVGHQPDLAASAAYWTEVSATNQWKLFDQKNTSQTAQSTSMSYRLRPGKVVTAVAVVNARSVQTIRVREISDAYGLVFDETIVRTRMVSEASPWAWFFGERQETLSSYTVTLPSFLDAEILVDFTGLSDMAVGTLLLGNVMTIGKAVQMGAELGIRSYSVKSTNEFGDIVLTKRPYSDTPRFTITLDNSEINSTYKRLKALDATPCLWIGSDIYEAMTVYGVYQDFKILIQYATESDCNLVLEGLT